MGSESTTTGSTAPDTDSSRKLRVEFWTTRLQHTHEHTQSSSKLLYLVDGAVLALLAFIVEKLRPSGLQLLFVAIPIAFLGLLSYYHAEIILRQREWYNAIDHRIREILDKEPSLQFESDSRFGGTHHIYSRIHKVIAGFLVIAAVAIGVYGFAMH